MTAMSDRSVQECEALLGYAKLNPADYRKEIQTITFDQQLNATELFLFELDHSVLNHLESGSRLAIKGDSNEVAVACTDQETFLVREAETSNNLLLLPQLIVPQDKTSDGDRSITAVQVVSTKHLYFEFKRCRPLIGKLKCLLEDSLFIGHVEDAADESVVDHCLTFDQILEQVQASRVELQKALKELNAVEMDGFVRLIDFDYAHQVLQSILDLTEEQEWSHDAVPVDQLCRLLGGIFPAFIVKAVLQQHCCEDATDFALDEAKVCAHFGENLLRCTTTFYLEEFEAAWQQVVPRGMTVDLKQLRGTALIDRQSDPPTVTLFRVLDLPDAEEQRFEFLFEKKEKWLLEEIEPFVCDLAGEGVTVSSLLTKNCRVSKARNGDKLYSTRKPK